MIAMMSKGRGFRGTLAYDMNPAKGRMIDTNMEGENVRELSAEFGQIRALRPGLEKAVLHTSISALPGEQLTDTQWREIGQRYLHDMGFTDNQFVITRHTDTDHEHIHVLANRIRFDGDVVSDSHDWRRQESIMRVLERDFNLHQVMPSLEVARHAPTRGEIEQGIRTGIPSIRQQLQQMADAAGRHCTSFTDYQAKLEAAGVELIPVVQLEGAKLSGLSYRLDGEVMKGSDLGKGYSPAGLAKKGITYVKDRDLAAVIGCCEREQARQLDEPDRNRSREQSQKRARTGRDLGATGPGDGSLNRRDAPELGRDRTGNRPAVGHVHEADRSRSPELEHGGRASAAGGRKAEPGRTADGMDSLRIGRGNRHPVGSAHDRILALACTADYRKQARFASDCGAAQAVLDRTLEAIQKQIKAMGGERFDLLIQKVGTGVKLSRTWTKSELEKVAGWLKRMNARGHEIFIRPSGDHGVVLVHDLKREGIARMQESAFAPAAVTQIGPDAYQAWVKLSDQAVAPRVRGAAAQALAHAYGGDVERAGNNHYGRLAGFTNQTPAYEISGQQPVVMARDCPGRVAANGRTLAQQMAQILEQEDLTQERQRRLNAINARQTDYRQSDPVYEYQRQAKLFLEKHGNGIDPARMDRVIATEMLKSGSYTQEGMVQALKFGSPHVGSTDAAQIDLYAKQTVKQVMSEPAMKRQMSLSHGLGLRLGR